MKGNRARYQSEQYRFVLEGGLQSYMLRRSRKARYLRMEISPVEGLVVTAPWRCSLNRIEQFIFQKRNWINKHLSLVKSSEVLSLPLADGKVMYFLGRPFIVKLRQDGAAGPGVELTDGNLIVSSGHSRRTPESITGEWYKQQAESLLVKKLKEWSGRTGIKYYGYQIRGQRTLWGSCSRKGKISLNWKLILLEESLIDYVIVHELVHLVEMNHGRNFWARVARYCPDHRQLRARLKKFSIYLHLNL